MKMNELGEAASLAERLQFGFSKKLPLQLQTEAAECGLACLSMIATFHGHRTDLATLRQRFSLSLKGTTVDTLVDMAASLQLSCRGLKLRLDEIDQLSLPCILHWDLDHFVVLKKVSSAGIVVHDPAIGARKYTMDEVSRHFTGIALELTVAPGFQRHTVRQKLNLRGMMGRVAGLKRSLLQITLLALALEVFALVAPFFSQWVIDQAVVSSDRPLLLTLALGFGLLMVITTTVQAIHGWAILMMSTSLNLQWLANLFSHLLKLPISYFEKRHMGDVISRFDSIHAIQGTLTTSFIGAILDGVMTIGTLAMMWLYSPTLSSIGIAAVVLYVTLRMCFYSVLMMATESEIVLRARQQSMFMETVRGVQSIRLFGKDKDRAARWMNVVVDQKNAGLRTSRLMLLFQTANSLLFGIEGILVMSIGALMVIDNTFSVGMLFAFMAYKSQFSARISSLVDKYFELKMLQLRGERLADITSSAPEEEDSPACAREVSTLPAGIEVRNLSFRYGTGEQPVLNRVSLTIEDGESVAIVGPSGCGKTTLVKILLGIHPPSAGEVLIGGVALRQLGLANYRKMVGAVMQEDQLFAGSVAENISFFGHDADLQWIQACANMAAIHDEILAMPMGYHTLVGDMGTTLSGGQKQRLLLARALFKKPKILFLDEATSHLDMHNEQIVSDAIRKLNLTRVIVAHRAETVRSADRVIHLGGAVIPPPRPSAALDAAGQPCSRPIVLAPDRQA
jgi:ATP-binding cassette subfamily B protein RaxB